MEDSLLDAEGFPRNDIDVYSIRHARQQIIRLRNDLKLVMDKISLALNSLHAQNSIQATGTTQVNSPDEPFAIVNAVSPDSPASEAGLKKDDLIIKFVLLVGFMV